MDEARLAQALSELLGQNLAQELSADFVKIRQDYATKTLERASPGKFVETFVQCLQQIATGTYDAKPNVDGYLNTKAENEAALPRDCASAGLALLGRSTRCATSATSLTRMRWTPTPSILRSFTRGRPG